MAELIKEGWLKGVAITTTALAVMTAIAAARGAACGAKTQLLTAQEASQWAYYQAKSIKQNLAESQKNAFEVEVLGSANDKQEEVFNQKIKEVTEDIARYDKEKAEIRQQAEGTAATNQLILKKGNFFSASVVFFQIAIMLSSVSALVSRKFMWIAGLVIGLGAAVLLGYGLFLKPLLF